MTHSALAIAARRDFDSRATVIELNDLIDPVGRRPEAQSTPVEQIEASGSPARRMAHDFNNLLGIITLNLELARERAGRGELREMIDEALDAAWQGSELAGHLAGFVWSRSGQPGLIENGGPAAAAPAGPGSL